MKDEIIRYLTETYHPLALLIYGSYQRGDQDDFSDFDCMIIVDKKEKKHDDTLFGNTQLDCFIFTVEETQADDIDTFLTAYDSEIVYDNGVGSALKQRVQQYVREHTTMDAEEKEFIVSWFKKTLRRMEKEDDEGNYRAVLLLWESLTDYFLLRDIFYFGSKWAVTQLKENDIVGYNLYHKAITDKTLSSIKEWAQYVITL